MLKPKLTLHKQFVIPAPFRAWCHPCDRGFMSLSELTVHRNSNEHIRSMTNASKEKKKEVRISGFAQEAL